MESIQINESHDSQKSSSSVFWNLGFCKRSFNKTSSILVRDFKSKSYIRYLSSLPHRMEKYFHRTRLERLKLTWGRRGFLDPQVYEMTTQRIRCAFDSELQLTESHEFVTPTKSSHIHFGLPTPPESHSSLQDLTLNPNLHYSPPSPPTFVGQEASPLNLNFHPNLHYITPSPSASAGQETWETMDKPVFTKRYSAFMASHSPLYSMTAESKRQDRVKKFLFECKATRNQIFNLRRGYWLCGLGNEHYNLGNELHISEGQDRRLDRDRDQSGPPCLKAYVIHHKHRQQDANLYESVTCSIMTIRGASMVNLSHYHQSKFIEADAIVKETFASRGIEADLSFVVEKGFTVDMCVVNNPWQVSNRDLPDAAPDQVLGCAMYVMMRNYVWVEEIAVKKEWRSCGVGSMIIDRLKQVAMARGKDVLLYALASAIPFYQSRGFKQLARWNVDCKTFEGQYLIWKHT